MTARILFSLVLSMFIMLAQAQSEKDYYTITTIPVPKHIVLEAGGVAALPDGGVAVATRQGDIWIVRDGKFSRFASGLHEILGLVYANGSFYCAQRSELTCVTDTNNDGRVDRYRTVYRWPLSGNYHEYSYGPVLAPDGSMFVTANIAFEDHDPLRGRSWVPWRGWTMRIWPDGRMEPWATGMRSPCGTGWIDDSFFYAENQGDWIGSGGLTQVEKGDFTGHPAGLDWADHPLSPVKVRKSDIYSRVDAQEVPPGGPYPHPFNKENERGERLYEIAAEVPGVKLPAVWLPHGVLGTSLSDIFTDNTNGKFGPFSGQVFVGDMGQSKINRVFLEKVNGVYQGAAFEFRSGFQSGVLRMSWGADGTLYVGQTNRGWGSTGKDPFGLQTLRWTGKTPFEMKAIRAMPDGFEIEFTLPLDPKINVSPSSFKVTNFIYKYHPAYGSPIVDEGVSPVKYAVVSEDRKRVRLVVDNLKQKHIHEISVKGLKAANGSQLLHPTGYYTLNEIPDGPKFAAPKEDPHQGHKMATTGGGPGQPSSKRITKMPATWSAPDQTITMGTLPGLKFDRPHLKVKAGSKIKLTFRNKDDMPHNLVIVMPGKALSVGQQALELGIQGNKLDYVPKSGDVLFHTRLVTAGTSDTIYFETPSKPGRYQFVCTYPGHYTIMQGILEVVK